MTIIRVIVTISPLRLRQLNQSEAGTNLRVGVEPVHQKFVMVYLLVFTKIFNRKEAIFQCLRVRRDSAPGTIPPCAAFTMRALGGNRAT
jgi:hypothetical protein